MVHIKNNFKKKKKKDLRGGSLGEFIPPAQG